MYSTYYKEHNRAPLQQECSGTGRKSDQKTIIQPPHVSEGVLVVRYVIRNLLAE